MKLNRFMLVSFVLLAIITFGAVSAASDDATADDAVAASEDLEISASDVSEITTDGGDVAIGSDANDDSKLSASAGDEELSAGSVAPNYTVQVTPNVTDAGNNYIAQYGQIITVDGSIENASGNVSIRFGYSGNYHDFVVPLKDGKFSQDITCYDRVRNNYQIQVKWAGNDYYKSISWSKNIHVQMENVTAEDAFYGLTPYMDVNLFNATGNVTFTLNGRNYTGKLENGKLIQEFKNYTIGKNSVEMYYSGDDRFNPIEKSFSFTVDANIDAPTIYNYQKAIITIYFGEAKGKVNISLGNESYALDIVDGVATTEFKNYTIGDNTLNISYSGDDTFNPFKTTKTFEVLDKENATIVSSVYQTAKQNFIFITIPHATGTINVTVNGKKEVWELVNESVKKDISPSDEINELTVSYDGNVRLNPTTSSFYVNLTDYIVNANTWKNYFNQDDDGRFYDFIEDGITLDFQGSIINPDSENEMNIIINKPVNIISTTEDAYIDLNCTAGSLLGEHPGSSFVVNYGGSGSNITGIYLHNTELWISNTTNVVFDNISVVVEDQRVGSGVGATSVRDNSSYVTLKNSYFYTRNNGGSTTFTFSWATHCVFDNNTVKVEGNVGNMLYLNVYNINNLPEPLINSWGSIVPAYPLNNYNTFSNNRLYGKEGSAISVGIMVEGTYNLIANNTLYKTSISTSFGGTGAANNTYYGNVLMEGSGFTAQSESIIYDNTVPGTLSTGTKSVAYNNTVGKTMTVAANSEAFNNTVSGLTVSGAGAIAHNNDVNGTTKVSGADVKFYENEVEGTFTVSGKNAEVKDNVINGAVSVTSTNVTIESNNVTGTIGLSSSANGLKLLNNSIKSDEQYAVDLSTTKENVIVGNDISGASLKGIEAINNLNPTDVVEDNYPLFANLTISVEDMLAGQDTTVVNVNINENATGSVRVIVNGETYYVKNDKGHGSVTLKRADFLNGFYSVVAIYDGDDAFSPSQALDLFCVFYYESELNVTVSDAKAGEDVVITAVLLSVDGTTILKPITDLKLFVDGVEYTVPFEPMSNVANYTIAHVADGTHTIVTIYPGDIGINACGDVTNFTLEKVDPVVDIAVDDLKLGEDAKVVVTIENATGKVNIIVDGVENIMDLTNGSATYTIEKVAAGIHTVVANYAGDDKFNAASASTSKELKVLATSFNDVAVDGNLNIKAALINSEGKGVANATIVYTMGNLTNTTVTGADGSFAIKGQEDTKVSITFEGSDLLFPTNTVVSLDKIAPSRIDSVLSASALKCYAVDYAAGERGALFKVTLKDANGDAIANETVIVSLDNKVYNIVTDENGTASMNVNVVKYGIYVASLSFLGNDYKNSAFQTAKISVYKKATKLVAKAKVFKAKAKSKKYAAALKTIKGSSADGKIYITAGKKVTLTVNKKTYTGKINKKGLVTFNLKKLTKKGTYKAILKFSGDDTYKGCTKKVIIKIK